MSSSSATILSLPRLGRPSGAGQVLSPAQARADALVSSFVDHATDGYSLAAMVGGGLVYRLGRVGTLALGSRLLTPNALPLTSHLLRLTSIGVGFTGEVFTFEAGQRALRVGIGGADPTLLRWSGENGLGRGLVGAAITLGSLKGTGVFVNGQNPVLQHLFQDSAMVLAHNVSGSIGITERPRESLAEQMVNAEATLWQMNAGMALVHGAAPALGQVERALDLSVRSRIMANRLANDPRSFAAIPLFATAGISLNGSRERSEIPKTLLAMSSLGDGTREPSGVPDRAVSHGMAEQYPTATARTRQISYTALPRAVWRLIQEIMRRTDESGLEFAAIALQFGDGTVIAPESNFATSHRSKSVLGEDIYDLFNNALIDAEIEGGLPKDGTVRIFDFHTHPSHPPQTSFVKSPNYVHEDGRPYTFTNDADWRSANGLFEVFVRQLRERGFTGPVELWAGAIPARVHLQHPELSEADGRRPYMATYFLNAPSLEETRRHAEGDRFPRRPPPILPVRGRDPEEAARMDRDFEVYGSQAFHRPAEDLPLEIQARLRALILASEGDGNEYRFFAMEFQDGNVETSEIFTSGNRFTVNDPAARERAIQSLLEVARQNIARGNPPVRAYDYHTHPDRGYLNEEGRLYTETNSVDCNAWDQTAHEFRRRLKAMGVTTPITVEGGALPVRNTADERTPLYRLPFIASYRNEADRTIRLRYGMVQTADGRYSPETSVIGNESIPDPRIAPQHLLIRRYSGSGVFVLQAHPDARFQTWIRNGSQGWVQISEAGIHWTPSGNNIMEIRIGRSLQDAVALELEPDGKTFRLLKN